MSIFDTVLLNLSPPILIFSKHTTVSTAPAAASQYHSICVLHSEHISAQRLRFDACILNAAERRWDKHLVPAEASGSLHVHSVLSFCQRKSFNQYLTFTLITSVNQTLIEPNRQTKGRTLLAAVIHKRTWKLKLHFMKWLLICLCFMRVGPSIYTVFVFLFMKSSHRILKEEYHP